MKERLAAGVRFCRSNAVVLLLLVNAVLGVATCHQARLAARHARDAESSADEARDAAESAKEAAENAWWSLRR